MFIDTHCHIEKQYYDDIDSLIKDNINAGCSKMIVSGCDLNGINETISLLPKYDSVYATIGFHPEEVDNLPDNYIDFLENLIKNNKKIVGIGEIGLDYHYSKDDKDKQIELFESQLKLAERLDMPVCIHTRDATEDTINSLKKFNVRGVIHCFGGSYETAQIYIKMGFKLGIGGTVTFKNSKLPDVLARLSLNDIVLETDSPYLTPVPFRGKTNSSKNIIYVIDKLCSVFNTDSETIQNITNKNVKSVYNIAQMKM